MPYAFDPVFDITSAKSEVLDLTHPLGSNAQEVVTDAMNTGVVIITSRLLEVADDSPALTKPFAPLHGAVRATPYRFDQPPAA